ncbi:MAG: DUF2723 domain-containing protein [Chloroflexi bacterium]|nr:DUF2723 domain-containing protein [Chloroflexota bacterium]
MQASCARWPWFRTLGPALGLFAASALLRLPFASSALVNWDAVQFALATRSFDLARHQPHPPGYILYVGWGRLLSWLTGDPNTAFVLTSLVASCLAVALLYLLGREMIGDRAALVAAALFALSPLLWYYSLVALTYAVEAFFLLVVAWLCWRAVTTLDERLTLWAGFTLGLAGGVRQSTLVMLLPLWLFVAVRAGRRTLWRGLAVLGATCLLWLVPLVWLSGGPVEYVRNGLSLLGFVGSKTSVVAGGLHAVLSNLAQVGGGLLIGLNLSAGLFGLSLWRRWRLPRRLSRHEWIVLGLWAGPALVVFVFGHIGQVGYLLLVLPVVCLLLGMYVEALGQRLTRPLRLSQGLATGAIVLVLALAHIATIVAAPPTAHALLNDPVAAAMVDVRDNDRFWAEMPRLLGRYTPEEAIVLAEASPWGSFRHAGYYLSEYRVYGIGDDRNGHFGWLYEAFQGSTDYSLDRPAQRMLPRPYDARYAIVLDPKILRSIAQAEPMVEVLATPYRSVYILDLGKVDTLTFDYRRTFFHGPTLDSRADIPRIIRDLRVDGGD